MVGALAFVAVAALMTFVGGALPELDPYVRSLGAWAPAAYLGLCVVSGVLMVPGSITKLAAGALFGLSSGLLWGFVGAVLGSVAGFAVARAGRRGWLERRLSELPRLAHFDRALADDGLRVAMLTRLSPVIPWNALNYAFGFSRIRTRDFLIASFGMLPSVWLYVLSGEMARSLVLAPDASEPTPWWRWVVLGVGVVATIGATLLIGRMARRSLAIETDDQADDSR